MVTTVIVTEEAKQESDTLPSTIAADITFRRPHHRDRSAIQTLIDDSLLIASDEPIFEDQDKPALVADHDGNVVGYVSAMEPDGATKQRKTLAIRHFALRDSLHDTNIASRMIKALLDRHTEDQSMRYVETRIDSFDDAPQSMLYALVKRLKTKFSYVFPKRKPDQADPPVVCRIGPVQG
jgi:hypothetical protein